jgi:NADH dehydrogenase
MGVDVRLNTPIEMIDTDGVVAKGERVFASTVVWCAGVRATPVGNWLGLPVERNGALRVGADLALPSHPDVFVLGDVARLDGADGKPLPGLAAVAEQQGSYVGRVLAAKIEGRPHPGPFRYRNLGTMATIGRSAAVADFGRFTVRGSVAWLLWGFVHVYLLIGFRNRAAVFLDWIWSWFTYGRGARLITGVNLDAYAAAEVHSDPQAQPVNSSVSLDPQGA